MTTHTYRIYCGLDTNGHLTTKQAHQLAERLALKYFPNGHTLLEAQGRWDQGGVAVTEPTLIVEVMTTTAEERAHVRNLAGAYKEQAFQEAVMMTRTEVEADFV